MSDFTNNGEHNPNSKIKFNNLMLNSTLCNYRDAYILVKETIIIARNRADVAAERAHKLNNQATFKNCASFTNCIDQTNSSQTHNS